MDIETKAALNWAMDVKTSKWDASKYLDNPEIICEYLKTTLEEGDTELLMMAIGKWQRPGE